MKGKNLTLSFKQVIICLPFLCFLAVLSCRKESKTDTIPLQTYVDRAKQFYEASINNTPSAKAVLASRSQTTQSANGRLSKPKRLLPDWEHATLERLANGKQGLTVPAAKFELQSTKLSLERKFVFEEEQGKIVDGKIVEVFGAVEDIKNRGEVLVSQYKENQIPNFTGVIISYDLNYYRQEGKYYKDGKLMEGMAYISSKEPVVRPTSQSSNWNEQIKANLNVAPLTREPHKSATAISPDKKIMAVTPVFEGEGQNCESFFLVYIVRDSGGNIVYWENLGFLYQVCDNGPVPDQPGGGPREVYIDCAGVVNGGAYDTRCGCIGGTTGILYCPEDPCDRKAMISTRAANSVINANKATIIANSTTQEWGAEQNFNAFPNSSTYRSVTPRTNGSTGNFASNFTWNATDGYTIGIGHGHPGGTGPSPKDAFWPLTNLNNSDLISSTGGWEFYKDNVSVTTYLPNGTAYLIEVRDWTILQAQYNIYLNDPVAYNNAYTIETQNYMIANQNSDNGTGGVWGLISQLGGAIRMYRTLPGSNVFKPVEKSGFTIQETPCNN
eukprot:gene17050-20311_t